MQLVYHRYCLWYFASYDGVVRMKDNRSETGVLAKRKKTNTNWNWSITITSRTQWRRPTCCKMTIENLVLDCSFWRKAGHNSKRFWTELCWTWKNKSREIFVRILMLIFLRMLAQFYITCNDCGYVCLSRVVPKNHKKMPHTHGEKSFTTHYMAFLLAVSLVKND